MSVPASDVKNLLNMLSSINDSPDIRINGKVEFEYFNDDELCMLMGVRFATYEDYEKFSMTDVARKLTLATKYCDYREDGRSICCHYLLPICAKNIIRLKMEYVGIEWVEQEENEE